MMAKSQPNEELAGRVSAAATGLWRPSAIVSAAAALLLLCPLTLRAQGFGSTMAAPMGQMPQVAIGQQMGPDGQIVNPDSSSSYQPPSDDSSGDSSASTDDNSDDSADTDNNDNNNDDNSDDASSGDDNSPPPAQPDSN